MAKTIEVVKVYGEGRVLTINKSDLAAFTKRGFSTKPEADKSKGGEADKQV